MDQHTRNRTPIPNSKPALCRPARKKLKNVWTSPLELRDRPPIRTRGERREDPASRATLRQRRRADGPRAAAGACRPGRSVEGAADDDLRDAGDPRVEHAKCIGARRPRTHDRRCGECVRACRNTMAVAPRPCMATRAPSSTTYRIFCARACRRCGPPRRAQPCATCGHYPASSGNVWRTMMPPRVPSGTHRDARPATNLPGTPNRPHNRGPIRTRSPRASLLDSCGSRDVHLE